MAFKFRPCNLDRKVAGFIKKKRGKLSYKKFAAKTGMSDTALFRYEHLEQSITLSKLDALAKRLGTTSEKILLNQ